MALPTHVVLQTCLLRSPNLGTRAIDLIPLVTSIDLYEDVFQNTISGTLLITDSMGLPEIVPMIGEEFISLKFSRPNEPDYEGTFVVTKLSERTFPREETQLYQLHFVTPEFLLSISSRLSRAFKKKTATEAIHEILQKDLKILRPASGLDFEDSQPAFNAVLPRMSPLQAVNFFAERAQSPTKQANYFFWQTLSGFHFKSLTSLMKEKPVTTVRLVPGNLLPPNAAANEVRPEEMQVPQHFDVLFDTYNGLFRSKTIGVDPLTRQYVEYDNNYVDDFATRKHLNAYPAYSMSHANTVSQDVKVYLVPGDIPSSRSAYIKSKEPTFLASQIEKTVDVRQRQLTELMHGRVIIKCPGFTFAQAGKIIDVRLPTTRMAQGVYNAQQNTLLGADKYHSGKHLIIACRHQLVNIGGKFEYKVILDAVKDSLKSPLQTF
jgi:hypothetical protein